VSVKHALHRFLRQDPFRQTLAHGREPEGGADVDRQQIGPVRPYQERLRRAERPGTGGRREALGLQVIRPRL